MDRHRQYRWVGINRSGQTVRGYLEAKNVTLAKVVLHQQGIQIQKIKSSQKLTKSFSKTRIKSSDITHLTRRFATLLKAQIPLVQILELLKCDEENHRIKALLDNIQVDVQSGLPLADALKKHPKYFNTLFCHIIKAGELSGALVILLQELATHRETRDKLKQNIRKSLSYPAAILSIACIVTLGLLLFVVPQFQLLFESFNATLPTATQWLIGCSIFIKTYGLIVLFTFSMTLYILKYFYQHVHIIALQFDTMMLKLPLIGPVIKAIIVARVIQTLSILLSAGLPLVEALKISATVTNNLYYTQEILIAQTSLTEGHPLKYALENTGLFPNMIIQLVGVGETSGQLTNILKHLTLQQTDTLKHQLEMLSGLFEPVLMAILGLWVGGLIIALYLPIFQLGAIVT